MKRILVVEDEAVIAEDVRWTLLRMGYDALPATQTCVDAVKAADDQRPDLVLMDIRLKGSPDGVEAARLISERFGIPVVFLTSHSDASTLSRAAAANPYGYLLKPFDERNLKVTLEVALAKRAAELAKEHSRRSS